MNEIRKWITTLSLAGLAVAALVYVLNVQPHWVSEANAMEDSVEGNAVFLAQAPPSPTATAQETPVPQATPKPQPRRRAPVRKATPAPTPLPPPEPIQFEECVTYLLKATKKQKKLQKYARPIPEGWSAVGGGIGAASGYEQGAVILCR